MFFADDVLCWEPLSWLTDAQLGQAFKLIVFGAKAGGSLLPDHPLLKLLDEKVVGLCTRRAGGRVEIIAPTDLPRLIAAREKWKRSRAAGAAGNVRNADGTFGGKKGA